MAVVKRSEQNNLLKQQDAAFRGKYGYVGVGF